MRLYLDTEFTTLNQSAKLLSIGVVDTNGRSFYAELSDIEIPEDKWLQDNVLCHMQWLNSSTKPFLQTASDHWQGYLSHLELAKALRDWLKVYPQAEVWADCVVWDWILFCELFGGTFEKPSNLYDFPFDLVTLLKVKGIDTNIERAELLTQLGKTSDTLQHHALNDATQTKDIVETLLNEPSTL